MRSRSTLRGRPPAGAALALRRVRRRWLRVRTLHGRLLAVVLVGGAGLVGVRAATAPAEPAATTVQVTVAATDLPAGHVITLSDLAVARWPAGTAPDGALEAPQGRALASAVRRGEPLTDARLLGPGLLRGQPAGTRAVTVRVADPAAAALARPGDRVDVLAAAADPAGAGIALPNNAFADVIVEGALVLASPGSAAAGVASGEAADAGTGLGALTGTDGGAFGAATGPSTDGLLVLAVDAAQARRLAGVVSARTLSVALRAGG